MSGRRYSRTWDGFPVREHADQRQWELRKINATTDYVKRGIWPVEIEPNTPEAEQFVRVADKIRRDLDAAPPMTLAQKVSAATTLWGGE